MELDCYSYGLTVYGGTTEERIMVRREILKTYNFQENADHEVGPAGEQWDECELEEFMIDFSGRHQQFLFRITETYFNHLGESGYNICYYGCGIKQCVNQHSFDDAVEDALLAEDFDRSTLPDVMLRTGLITSTGDGGLYRIKPALEDGRLMLSVAFELDGEKWESKTPLSKLLDLVKR